LQQIKHQGLSPFNPDAATDTRSRQKNMRLTCQAGWSDWFGMTVARRFRLLMNDCLAVSRILASKHSRNSFRHRHSFEIYPYPQPQQSLITSSWLLSQNDRLIMTRLDQAQRPTQNWSEEEFQHINSKRMCWECTSSRNILH